MCSSFLCEGWQNELKLGVSCCFLSFLTEIFCPSALRSNTCTKSHLKVCFLLCIHVQEPITMAVSEENKFPPSFLGFKSETFLHKSSYDRVSGTDNDEQSLNNSANVFHLWLLEAFSWFQNGSILLVDASCSSCKRLALIIEHEFKNTYFCWLL